MTLLIILNFDLNKTFTLSKAAGRDKRSIGCCWADAEETLPIEALTWSADDDDDKFELLGWCCCCIIVVEYLSLSGGRAPGGSMATRQTDSAFWGTVYLTNLSTRTPSCMWLCEMILKKKTQIIWLTSFNLFTLKQWITFHLNQLQLLAKEKSYNSFRKNIQCPYNRTDQRW